MANIISITIKKDIDGNLYLGVVKDDNFAEIIEKNVSGIQPQLLDVYEFAENIKTEEQKALEKQKEKNEELLVLITEKTTDEEKLEMIEIFPEWEVGKNYKKDNYVKYQDKLYKVLQNHESQADWTPDIAVSLYVEVLPPNAVAEYKQPTGAHDAYNTGDRVIWKNKIYICLVDGTVHNPDEAPRSWEYERDL